VTHPPQMLTAQRLVERSLRSWRDRPAVVDGERRETYATLRDRSGRLANVLLDAHAGADNPAATLLPNTLEFVEVDVACARAGITRLGISERLSADECRYLLADSEAAVLVATRSLFEALEDELPDSLRLILLVGEENARNGSIPLVPYEHALAAASSSFAAGAVSPETANYILYTSGTTGRPKGATHTHGGRAASTLNMLASELVLRPRSVMVHAGPLTHGSGSKLISFLAAGAVNVILPKFTPEAFARAVVDEGGTHTFLVPTMIQRLLEAGDEVVGAVSALEQISFGGSPISAALFRRAIESFGSILTQVYGSSEAPHPITLLRPRDYEDADASDAVLTSAGRVAYGVDVKFVDDDDVEVAQGELGELLIRSANLMRGYWRNDEATGEVLTEDGWYRAGDLATVDDDGYVTFQDRKRDLIISGGLNVYPSEVERAIAAHPGVREVAVVGAPDEEWGEAVVAYVVPIDSDLDAAQIIEWTRERLAHYKKPQRVEFLDSLPLGSSNKVLKRELRDKLWQGHERRVN
jgi:acyl-CoA synthetase (AMP-forming)/AMP-acid ligase II